MAEKCGNITTRVTGSGFKSGPKAQKIFIQNIARQMALTDAELKAFRWIDMVKCKNICPVKTYSIQYHNRDESESTDQSTGIYSFSVKTRLDVNVKCSKILSVPLIRR